MSQENGTFEHEDSASTSTSSTRHFSSRKQVRGQRSPRAYQCPVEGCRKVYSRAEHLSRHQLNHDPKEIFRCHVPKCNRSFVRADLHSRHESRHVSEYLQQQSQISDAQHTDYSGSPHSPDLMDFTPNSTLEAGRQVQIHREYSAQAHGQYVKSTETHQLGGDDTSDFLIREGSCQVPMLSSQSNNNLSQQEQLPHTEIWRNAVPGLTPMPLFGGDSYTRAPFTIPDDFIQFLFNGGQPNLINDEDSRLIGFSGYTNAQNQFYESPDFDIFSESYFPHQPPSASSTTSHETNLPSATLSDEKSKEIYDLVRDRLTGNKHTPALNFQNNLLEGDRSQDFNIMSRNMMQEHINSYWMNFHSQLPILHRPTFRPNETPNLLLIAIMIIGAACSIKSDDHTMARLATEFSTVLAWYLRWEIFSSMHTQSNNLWVFQTLLLLETYEKTYSSRTLHEQAHIHHATAIMLMRRGSFLVGITPPAENPTNHEDNESEGQISTTSPSDIWWERWIRREATRRVAFAAFMIDSSHAAMFGHSMIMVTHEMRLVLPCDDALWSATSVSEVRKVETMLRLNGVKPLPFLEGLQRTLNGQEIHTNAFGRSILLCGLLSVSWHMNQREQQINSLDVKSNSGDRGTKWRRSITRAFDLWRGSYEQTTQDISNDMSKWTQDGDALLSNRSALYHLAQLSVHADILECQVSAGANRVLGRIMRKKEVENARRQIQNTWAPTVEARRATFYAIRFICSVFCKPTDDEQVCDRSFIIDYATSNTTIPMHRWVLYFASLIVWCYSYAVDGPPHVQTSTGSTIDEHIQDMLHFLRSTEKIKSPEDVAFHRLNGCAGMLKVLCYIFRLGTWELLHEGADLLTNCIKLIDSTE